MSAGVLIVVLVGAIVFAAATCQETLELRMEMVSCTELECCLLAPTADTCLHFLARFCPTGIRTYSSPQSLADLASSSSWQDSELAAEQPSRRRGGLELCGLDVSAGFN
mmetsp:Transcript_39054/g.90546  ORF Transcript_39054/g.90546 Transcript_39054/m.90546 type:complete len:109 (+) Transcript_39054:181-507(+)